jgi:hypothetical protein
VFLDNYCKDPYAKLAAIMDTITIKVLVVNVWLDVIPAVTEVFALNAVMVSYQRIANVYQGV